MKCPIDGVDLVMSERQGVEIDYCPTCRGIWLDRGELDKILDRAAAEVVPPSAATLASPAAPAAYGQPAYPATPQDHPAQPYPTEPYRGSHDGYRDRDRDDYRDRDRDGYRDGRGGYDPRRDPRNQPYRKKKESWLSDILDFG
ncbi:zf-TFIIB domain-containing protein [Actinotalea ferrariae]|uniref:TFIIB-type zinc ribbon-containing protein n=1 Tax=Actinotalea ferrariae TaxID=1386098 RepID=UPI001C8C07E3|nr:zf-TFIIB domain-containing protein [Actinotalea ferrariae]MBX9245139.1 zf-TFIIB domain-containing protein [Actinotalea ferrariae]